MYSAYPAPPTSGPLGWLRRAEAWLDDRGKAAWIAAMVLGFVFVWPVGLAILAYMIWSKRMFGRSCRANRGDHTSPRTDFHAMRGAFRPSGNSAFDSYKSETLRRLQDEQEAFESFLRRLRDAKDKTEFDTFMEERARKVAEAADTDTDTTVAPRRPEPGNPAAGY